MIFEKFKSSIGWRLYAIFLSIVLLMSALGAYVYYFKTRDARIYDKLFSNLSHINRTPQHVVEVVGGIIVFSKSQSPETETKILAAIDNLISVAETTMAQTDPDHQKSIHLIEGILNILYNLQRIAKETLEQINVGEDFGKVHENVEFLNIIIDVFGNNVERYVSSELLHAAKLRQDINQWNKTLGLLLVFFVSLNFSFVLLLVMIVRKSIIRPIQNLEQCVTRLQGNETFSRVDVTTSDEIGSLSEAFNSMLENLQQSVAEKEKSRIELEESEERFRALVESTSDWIWEVNSDGNYTYCSPQIKTILGYEPDEILGKSPFDLMTKRDADRVMNRFNNAIEHNLAIESLENENLHKDGHAVILETSGVPIIDAVGELNGYRGIDRDITLRKKTEESLRQSEGRFRQVFENIGVGIAIYEARNGGEDFIFKDINPYGAESGEMQREEHIGRSVLEVYPGVREIGLFDIFREVWQTGRSRNHPISQYQDDRITLWVENFVSKLPSGEVMAVYEDVTAERKAEEALKISEHKLRTTLDATPFPIALVDLEDDVVEYWSQSALELFGHTAPTASKWYEMAYPDPAYRQEVIEKWKPVLELASQSSSPVNAGEYRVTCSDGSERICLLYATFLPGNLVVTFHDITERKRVENELADYRGHLEELVEKRTAEIQIKNKELETFTYSVSHDLKAPLRGIDGYSRLLTEEYADKLDEEGLKFLTNVRQSAEQMNQLIEDLLAYSRMERRSIHTAPIELRSFIELLTTERQHDIESGRIQVNTALPFNTIRADSDTVRQVLGNYLDNAIKFSKKDDHPLVEISGSENDNTWTLWVKDNGIGFDPEYRDRIFQIFQRLHRIEDYPGTGVGLAIVRKAVERMGGRVWAKSELGKGATFFVEIPKMKTKQDMGAYSE